MKSAFISQRLPFGGRVEKIDSIAASYAASAFSLLIDPKSPVSFDARIIQVTRELAAQYLINRQHEAWRNHMNAVLPECTGR